MLKTALAGAAGLALAQADAMDVNTAIQNIHTSLFMQQQSLFDSPEMQMLADKTTTVPCQYWYDDKWYDLTSFDDSADYFLTSPHTSTDQYAAFNFCQKISSATTTNLDCDQS